MFVFKYSIETVQSDRFSLRENCYNASIKDGSVNIISTSNPTFLKLAKKKKRFKGPFHFLPLLKISFYFALLSYGIILRSQYAASPFTFTFNCLLESGS